MNKTPYFGQQQHSLIHMAAVAADSGGGIVMRQIYCGHDNELWQPKPENSLYATPEILWLLITFVYLQSSLMIPNRLLWP